MLITGLFQWWYGQGWLNKFRLSRISLSKTADFFSIGILAKTLFAPFRQISATSGVNDTIGEKLRAAFDKLFSRVIGAVMRTGMIIIGLIALAINAVFLGLGLVLWPLIPLMPIAGITLLIVGWVPLWT